MEEMTDDVWIDKSRYVGIVPPIMLIGGGIDVAMVHRAQWLVPFCEEFDRVLRGL